MWVRLRLHPPIPATQAYLAEILGLLRGAALLEVRLVR
jgi:hypothetical protein